MNSNKIADAMIRESRGILSLSDKPAADTIQWPQPAPEVVPDTHVMTLKQHEALFGKRHHEPS